MKGTRFKLIIRQCLGQINHESRIALTPVTKDGAWAFLVGCYNSGTTLLVEWPGQLPLISALFTRGQFITYPFVKDDDMGLPCRQISRIAGETIDSLGCTRP